MTLSVNAISVQQNQQKLIEYADFTLQAGELIALLGPNGAGKTSLIRASLGLLPVCSGSVILNGAQVGTVSPTERARTVAYLPQSRPLAWPARVRDVVALGRFSYGAAPASLSGDDAMAVEQALTLCDLQTLAERRTNTLSGGELARVHCARAFATQAPLLIADEPTAALDPQHQFRIMDLMAQFVDDGGGALLVLHDIALAARYATRLLWMNQGCIIADGTPQHTLTADRLASLYGVKAQVNGLSVQLEGLL